MSLFARALQRTDAGLPEKRMLTSSAFVPPPYDGLVGDLVSEVRAMQSSAVWSCVGLLADVIASMPWYVYRRDKNNVPQRIYPTPGVIRKPTPVMDLFQWKWMVVAALCLRGNSFHLVTARDPKTLLPTGLMPLHPDMVHVERRVNVLEWFDPIYRVMGERVPTSDIIHIRRFTMPGEPLGLSPIRQAARTIGLALSADEYGHRYFRDSANPSSVLKTDQTLPDDDVAQVQAQWMASHAGARFPAVLTGGFDWKPISISPEESQFLETRGYQVSDIARIYRIPPHLIGDQEKATSWGTGIESMNLGFHTYTVQGWTTCIESAISNYLPKGQVVKFDNSTLLKGDLKTRLEAYNIGRQAGLWNADEIRAKEELGPIPGGLGKGYIQPGNMNPLGFNPVVTPMPKVVPEGTEPSHGGQEPEPSGIGGAPAPARKNLNDLAIRSTRDGRPEYYDPHTGETVDHQEAAHDQES